MSVNQSPRFADDDIKDSKIFTGSSSALEQDHIDCRLKRLREEVLPFYPFLLTVPTDVPFRLGGRFVNNWAVSNEGPFSPEEQQLQYMTFLTHHEGDSLLVAVGDWSDGTGNVMSDQRPGPQSAASTPSSGPIKKKISLNDYKNKRQTGASASPVGQESTNQNTPKTVYTVDDNPHIYKADRSRDSLPKHPDNVPHSQPSARHGFENLERKRPPESDHEHTMPQERKQLEVIYSKRPRLSPDSTTTINKLERSKNNGLPALLSPTLPPTSSSPRLPRLLSPTLPPDIEKELARQGDDTFAIDSPRPKNTHDTELKRVKSQKAKPSDRGTAQSDSARTIGRQSSHSKLSNPVSETHPSASLDSTLSDTSDTPKTSSASQTSDKPNNLGGSRKLQSVVKLKYGRSNKKRVEALLKFSGKKKPVPQNSPVKDPVDTEQIQSIRAEQNAIKPLASARLDSKDSHAERKIKPMASSQATVPLRERSKESRVSILEKPRTPVSAMPGSTLQAQEKAKQISITPGKDSKDSTQRPSETAGSECKMPLQPSARYPPEDLVNASKSPPPQSNNQVSLLRNGERRAWKDEYQKYGNLGRELKHAAERHTAKDNTTGVDEKLAVATAIEAILCFILAFVAEDQSKALTRQVGDSSSWQSILAYWRVVKKNSTPYPRLYSLCLILGAVSYDAIHYLDLERLAVTPLPGEHTPLPTPGSDGVTASSDEMKRNRREIQELKSRLPECYKESQRLWLEGLRGLSEDILTREFPNTWSKRSKRFSEQGKQRLKVGDYSGEFYLPLARTSSSVETARFGYAMLKEWCKREGVHWSGRIGL